MNGIGLGIYKRRFSGGIPQPTPMVEGFLFAGAFTFVTNQPITTINSLNKTSFTNVQDTSFKTNGGSGFGGLPAGSVLFVRSIYQYKTGPNKHKILCAGNFLSFDGTPIVRIARLNVDGSLDTTFSTGSVGFNADVAQVLVDEATQKIYAVGNFTSYQGVSANRIIRLNPSGSIDSTFGTGFNNGCQSIDQDSSHIYCGGSFIDYDGNPCSNVVRIEKSTGNLISPPTGPNNDIFYLRVDVNDPNYIIVGGNNAFTNWSISSCKSRIARVNVSTWALDTAFNSQVTDFNARISHIDFAENGKILLSGNFTNYASTGRNYIVMLNTNGSLYTTFNPVNPNIALRGANYFPKAGKIGLFGSFTTYAGLVNRERVAVVDANTGAVDNNFNDKYYASIGQDGWMGKEV